MFPMYCNTVKSKPTVSFQARVTERNILNEIAKRKKTKKMSANLSCIEKVFYSISVTASFLTRFKLKVVEEEKKKRPNTHNPC